MELIKKTTLREDVSRRIRDSIFNNSLKPGERIVETKLAKNLGVSQSPVREAIRELEMMGLVENRPFVGCFVKKLTAKDIKDTYKVRAYLEMLAVTEATKNITEEQLEDLDDVLIKMNRAAKVGDVPDFIELDIIFHRLIIKTADNSLLEKMWNNISLAQWTHITAKYSKKTLIELASRHQLIFQKIKEKDREQASECIKNHIEELSEEILMRLEVE